LALVPLKDTRAGICYSEGWVIVGSALTILLRSLPCHRAAPTGIKSPETKERSLCAGYPAASFALFRVSNL